MQVTPHLFPSFLFGTLLPKLSQSPGHRPNVLQEHLRSERWRIIIFQLAISPGTPCSGTLRPPISSWVGQGFVENTWWKHWKLHGFLLLRNWPQHLWNFWWWLTTRKKNNNLTILVEHILGKHTEGLSSIHQPPGNLCSDFHPKANNRAMKEP